MRGKGLSDTTKGALRVAIAEIREKLLADIRIEAERRYRFEVELEAPPDPTADDRGANRMWREKADRVLHADAGLRAGLRADRCVLEKHLATRAHADVPRDRALSEAVAESAATTLQRLVLVRHLEATGLVPMKLLTGVERSEAYVEARAWMPSLVGRPDDPSKGFSGLLELLFAELARDLPGLFGDVGTTRLFPAPGATLLQVLERLDSPELAAAWDDDTTVGWVYQFWNAAEKARIDAKIGEGDEGPGKGKVAAHEIAPKTALYTERYMVEWLIQNSLGPMWLAICAKHRWAPDARAALDRLAGKRAGGSVEIDDDLEDRWKYYVEAPVTDAFVAASPDSVRTLKVLDPAVGSGHFLVAAFDWLFPVWQEEGHHRGETWSDAEIARGIVENNLHGIDIDPVAVRLAAAAVWLKARLKGAHAKRLNLVASQFEMGRLSDAERKAAAERISEATPLDPDQVEKLLGALSRADVLGSLLDVDRLDERGIRQLVSEDFSGEVQARPGPRQARLFDLHQPEYVRQTALAMLRSRLSGLSRTDDLGVRLGAEQVEAGLRFASLARSGQYDVVMANPPYLTTRKMEKSAGELVKEADLYAAFLVRALDLVHLHGVSAMVTRHSWMFTSQFEPLRASVLSRSRLGVVADLGVGAFSEIGGHVTQVCMFSMVPECRAGAAIGALEIADEVTFVDARDRAHAERLLTRSDQHMWPQTTFSKIPGSPLVYSWSSSFLDWYLGTTKLEEAAPSRRGLGTCDDERFLRRHWEVDQTRLLYRSFDEQSPPPNGWVPFTKGAAGTRWMEGLDDVIDWNARALSIATYGKSRYGRGAMYYFEPGVAFSPTGSDFSARAWRYRAVIGDKAPTFVPRGSEVSVGEVLCSMMSARSRYVGESLNPTLDFKLADAKRLPFIAFDAADDVFAMLGKAFAAHERSRETAYGFESPGPSGWERAQRWASAVIDATSDGDGDGGAGDVHPARGDFLSFAVGQTLGRFAGRAVPGHILFAACRGPDNVESAPDLVAAWDVHGDGDLRRWLRERFFIENHLDRYEKRPIHWPLSSKNRNFVAWVCIHSWTDDTLERLRADHVAPCLRALEGELADLRAAPPAGKKARGKDPVTELKDLVDELRAFDRLVERVAIEGPDLAKQELKAPFRMELDDGVRVNSAILHPLLAPQWKEPAKWWGEIAGGGGKKAAFWSRTAARYWPRRVAERCEGEPSHAVAHRCFWRHHRALAWKWELQLQDEIGSHYRHDEPDADAERTAWVTGYPEEALAGLVKEAVRRRRKLGRRAGDPFVVEAFERGIWASIPGEVWDAESKLIKSMKRDVRLVDPDEAAQRAAWVAADPRRVADREMLLVQARAAQLNLLEDDSDDEEDEPIEDDPQEGEDGEG